MNLASFWGYFGPIAIVGAVLILVIFYLVNKFFKGSKPSAYTKFYVHKYLPPKRRFLNASIYRCPTSINNYTQDFHYIMK